MAKIHKSATVCLDSSKPVILDLPVLAAGVREKMCPRPDSEQRDNLAELRRAAVEAELQAREDAGKVLAEARLQADIMIAAASREAVSIREVAFNEGMAAGRCQSSRQMDALEVKLQTAFDQQIAELRQQNEKMIIDLEPELLELSMQIAEKILGLELSRNDTAFLGLVSSALSRFKQGEKITIQVSKNDYWRTMVSSIYAASGLSDGITIMADDSLANGSCVVESAAGTIDAGSGIQMDKIREGLLEFCQEAEK